MDNYNKKTAHEFLNKVIDLIAEPIEDDIEDNFFTSDELFDSAISDLSKPSDSVKINGYGLFSKFIGDGLMLNEFSIICGPTGKGKTTWIINLAMQLMSQWTPVMIACIENGSQKAMQKSISIISGKKIYKGMPEAEIKEASESSKAILKNHNSVFMKYDSRVKHLRLLADILYCYEKFGTKVVFVDNLNFMMEVKRGSDSLVEMDTTIHDFVIFCKKIPVHVFMVMHPKKTDNGKVKSIFDIKGSSTAVQEASNVFLFNEIEKDSFGDANGVHSDFCREIELAKLRENGRCTGSKIFFAIDEKSERMREIGHAQ